ncbi:MAG: site-2 protease family protein [Anaerolineales bacterium]
MNEQVSAQAALRRLRETLDDFMEVETVRILSTDAQPSVEFEGHLHRRNGAFEELFRSLRELGYTPTLRETEEGVEVLRAVPGTIEEENRGKPWVNLLLFLATLLSVLFIGAANEGGNPLQNFSDLWLGLPFAATLMGILTAHELSHYFVGRKYGSPVSLPYFIPLPLNILGTMGAVIVQKGPMRSRKALFDIGAAGPLGGLVVALPLLVVGLLLSKVEPLPTSQAYFLEGNSLLYYFTKWVIFGRPLPAGGVDVMLHPVAFAAWAGLLVTSLNLFPIGQLDGGHITYAMWGRRAWTIAKVVVGLIFAWGLVLNLRGNPAGWTWFVWGLLGLFVGARHPAPLNDVTPLGRKRRIMGWIMTGLFLLTLVPLPLTVVTP